jgi:UDP:flavonoid glycosyltransferase YjiC (YdhE family)
MAEAVTLAHVARPFVLATALSDCGYRVEFACSPRFDKLFPDATLKRRSLWSIPAEQFLSSLRRGSPVYDARTLERYVVEDLQHIHAVRPDLIVGDFRLSLSISARLTSVPYLAISNAYWSPYIRQRYPVPDLPMTRILGVRVAQPIFDLIRPAAFALHTRPLNRVRRKHGLNDLGFDLRATYTDADFVLYADVQNLFSVGPLPDTHAFLGPVLWSPSAALPEWWNKIGPVHPIVYVNLGSSGPVELFPQVLLGLAQAEVYTIAATAGKRLSETASANIRVTEYLPGNAAAEVADLVVCNGGSPGTQQAIAKGTPVLGIPSNLDQHLNMQAVAASGAGVIIRSEQLTPGSVTAAVGSMLSTESYSQAAAALQDRISSYQPNSHFVSLVERLVA